MLSFADTVTCGVCLVISMYCSRALSARPMESSEFTITAKGELYPSDNSKGSSVMGMSAASTDSTSTNFHQV